MRVGADLFAKRSYAAATTRELAKALGITNGTFYHYFPTKEDLLVAICEESLSRITAAAAAVDEVEDDEERLRTLIDGHVAAMLRDQSLHRTMLIELRSLDRRNVNRVLALRDEYSGRVRGVIEAAQKGGVVRTDLDSHTLTLMLLNLLNWTIFWFKQRGDLSREEVARVLTTSFIDGAHA